MKVPSIRSAFARVRSHRWYGASALAILLVVPAVMPADGNASPAEDKAHAPQTITWQPSSPTSKAAVVELVQGPIPTDLQYVGLSQPCRFYDTRVGSTPFAANEQREISVNDTLLPAGLGPCFVPTTAAAVDLSLSTIGGTATGTGFVRIGPGGVAPTATVLQFTKGQGVSVTTTTPISGSFMRIKSFGAGAGYVADLLGYWQRPMFGVVNGDGTLADGSGITLLTKSVGFLGDYYITFDRQISPGCSVVATATDAGTRLVAQSVNSTQWFFDVRAFNSTAEADGKFSFVVQC